MRKFLIVLLILFQVGATSRDYDGTGDNVDYGDNDTFSSTSFTYGGWVRPDNLVLTNNARAWIATKGAASNYEYSLYTQGVSGTSAHFRSALWTSAGAEIRNTGVGSSVTNQTWYHVLVTWDGTTLKLIINGVAGNEDSTGSGSRSNGTASFITGQRGDAAATDWDGQLSQVVYYSKVLTLQEANEIMWKPEMIADSRGLMSPQWGDATEPDLSGNSRVGTVTGAGTSGSGAPYMYGGGLPL